MSRTAAELLRLLKRDAIAVHEARETYEVQQARLRREGAHLTSRRLKRASLAELLNPDTPGYGGTRER